MLDSQTTEKAGRNLTRLSSAQRNLKREFVRIRDNLDLAEVQRQLEFGNYEGAIDGMIRPFEALGDILAHTYIESARAFTDHISAQLGGRPVSFNPTTPRVVNDLRNMRAFFLQDFNRTARDAQHAVILAGLRDNVDPPEIARQMLGAVGLTARDLTAIENYADGVARGAPFLDTAPQATKPLPNSVTKAIMERMVISKARLTRDSTLNRLALTQAQRAINMGEQGLLEQLIDTGVLQDENIQRTWATVGDPKVRDSHAAMNGQTQPFGKPFISGKGSEIMYPGDPDAPADEVVNCRCGLLIEVQRSR